MSRFDDLLTDLCPAGVSYGPLEHVTGRAAPIRWATAGATTFRYIDLTSVDRVTRQIRDTATISAADAPSRAQQLVRAGDVIFATTRPAQMRLAVISPEYDGQIASTGYCVLRPNTSLILTNYLAHVLGTKSFRSYVQANQVPGNYPSIPDSRVREYRIPLPPLEMQREIARILDSFSQLEAELEAELEARRRQYAFYRDRLLAFPEGGIPRAPMGELGEFFRGRRFVKDDVVDEGIPAIHYGEIYTHYGVSANEVVTHVREGLAPSLRYAQPGDVVIAAVGETVEDVAKAVAWLGDKRIAIHDDTFVFRSALNPKFVSYALQTADYHRQKSRYVARAKVKRLTGESLARIEIPSPPVEDQALIVEILDKFDALMNDLVVGLPAELAARRKQYEYYREKLLTFEEAAA